MTFGGNCTALAIAACLCACSGSSIEPDAPTVQTVMFAGILRGAEGAPVAGATLRARAYLFDSCGVGEPVAAGGTETAEDGSYEVGLELQREVSQCVAFGAWKALLVPANPADTGVVRVFPGWVVECTPPSPCRESSITVAVQPPTP